MSHLRPIDGDGTGEPPLTDVEQRAAAAAYAVRVTIDWLAMHLYVFVALAAAVGLAGLAGLWAALVAALILGALAAATLSNS